MCRVLYLPACIYPLNFPQRLFDGYDYVQKNYLWSKIIDDYRTFLDTAIFNKKTRHEKLVNLDFQDLIGFPCFRVNIF